MKILEITLITLWVIGTFGVMATGLLLPKTRTNNEPLSPFVVMDKPLDNRPVMGLVSLDEKYLITATDENVYVSHPEIGSYNLNLPHSLWENEQPFIAGNYVYCAVNRFHRNANQGLKQLFRAHKDSLQEGPLNWKRITPEFSQAPDLIAIDVDRKILYGAQRFVNAGSSLTARQIDNYTITHIGNKELKNISAIAVFQGVLFVAANNQLFASYDLGESFKDITSSLPDKTIGLAQMLVNEHYLVLNIAKHYTYIYDGKVWKEITAKTVKHGHLSFYEIKSLKDHKLVISQLGVGKIQVVHLKNGEWQPIRLPKFYRYNAFSLQGQHLYVSATLPKDPAILSLMGKKIPDPRIERNQFLFRVPLKSIPVMHALWGNRRPEVIAESKHLLGHGTVIDSANIYRNNGKRIINVIKGDTMSGFLKRPFALKKGKIKGDWFVYHKGVLHRSNDKGKQWNAIDNGIILPHHAIIDDSLNIAYSHNGYVLSRFNLITGEVDYNEADEFKGKMENIHLDKTGRLFVQTNKGVYISHDRGFWGCPFPKRKNKNTPIKGFAFVGNNMAITFKNKIYISRTDVIEWEEIPLCQPDNDNLHLQVRIIGFDQTHLILQEQHYGHIIVLNPETRSLQRFILPKENGIIQQANIAGNRLIIETTGIPFYPLKGSLPQNEPARLLSYQLNLKHFESWTH